MLHKFSYPPDFSLLELQNALLHFLSPIPAGTEGQFGYDPAEDVPIWRDASQWHRVYPPYNGSDVSGDFFAVVNDGVLTAPTFNGDLDGTANLADALSSSRNFSITGKATAAAVGFDGTGAVELDVTALSVELSDINIATGMFMMGNGSGKGTYVDPYTIPLSIWAAPTNNVTFANYRITNLADPINSQDAATRSWVLGVLSGVSPKYPVEFATAAGLPAHSSDSAVATTLTASANAALTIDGDLVTAGDRVLVKNESGASEKNNGVYEVLQAGAADPAGSPWILKRATDADSDAEVSTGDEYFVSGGDTNAGTKWALKTLEPITLGTTALEFVQTWGSTAYFGGRGITAVGNTFNFGNGSDFTQYAVPYANDASTIAWTAAPAQYQVMVGGADLKPTWGQVDLGSAVAVTGYVRMANGGTGQIVAELGRMLVGTGTGWRKMAVGAVGTVVRSNVGGASPGTDVEYGKVVLGPSPYTGTKPASASIHVDGILTPYNGGTGINVDLNPFTTNAVMYATSSNQLGFTAAAGTSTILQKNNSGVPTFVAVSGDVTIATGGAVTIGSRKVTYEKMQDTTQSSIVLGRKTASGGLVEEITFAYLAAALSSLIAPSVTLVGPDVTGTGPIGAVTATISNLAFTKLQNGSALSVLGVTGAVGASVASIAASSDHQVLRRSGSSVEFGAIRLDSSAAVTNVLQPVNGGTGRSIALVFPTIAGSVPRFFKTTLVAGATQYLAIAHGFGTADLSVALVDSSGTPIGAKVVLTSSTVSVYFARATDSNHTLMLTGAA